MLRKLVALCFSVSFIAIAFLLVFVAQVGAASAQNIYGIHISDKSDIPEAAKLVNGNEGEWGYVTLVIQSNDRLKDKWQPIFYDLMEYKLQPIVRIATKVDGSNWSRPSDQDAKEWADFLSSLYWPTDEHIVSIYNEVNHGTEWGGAIDPAGYAKVLDQTIAALRSSDPKVFILPAAFDQSTPQEPPLYGDQLSFMQEMEKAVPGIFQKVDGWASHSYPNPGFAGNVEDSGRRSIRGYEWELEVLKNQFGVTKNLPVYIKETGWTYKGSTNKSRTSIETAAQNIQKAFNDVWLKDARVAAVTPFIIRSKSPDFMHFSWLTMEDQPTEMFLAIQKLPKLRGNPKTSFDAEVKSIDIPSSLALDREIGGTITYMNTGSMPWRVKDLVRLNVIDPEKIVVRENFSYQDEGRSVMPGQSYTFRFQMKVPVVFPSLSLTFQPQQQDQAFGEKLYLPLQVYALPQFVIKTVPQREIVQEVQVGIRDQSGKQKIYDPIDLPVSGELGTFEDIAFQPNVPVQIVISSPRRDKVSIVTTPREGINEIEFILPDEKNALVLFAENFARALRRS